MAEPTNVKPITSPFQLFTAFTENDRDKFFGRDDEIAILNQLIQESNLTLVYGESGTGKTSLVQCGLLNETKHFNWSNIAVRRMEDINASFRRKVVQTLFQAKRSSAENEKVAKELGTGEQSADQELKKNSEASTITQNVKEEKPKEDQPIPELPDTNIIGLAHKVFLENFQPILLIFDQFEELYVFGTEPERINFYKDIKALLKLGIPCKIVFVMREEYIAQLTEFEIYVPAILKKQLRIELVNKAKCREVIVESCSRFNIELSPLRKKTDTTNEEDVPEKIINIVSNSEGKTHLPYLQIFLDTLWKKAYPISPEKVTIDLDVVYEVGNMGNVLKAFLEEKAENLKEVSKLDIWKLLKLFVPEQGTIRKRVRLSDYTAIPSDILLRIFQYLEDHKIISSCGEGLYELAHDSLVPIIQDFKISEVRSRLAVPTLSGPPYKGLESYGQADNDRFYGRENVITAVYEKIRQQGLVVIVGNSGAGKSSLIKAGLFPLMEKDGYEIVDTVRKEAIRGQNVLRNFDQILLAFIEGKKYILLIDQYEELITRVGESKEKQEVAARIYDLLLAQKNSYARYELRIVITVRADFEPQFSILKPLEFFWKAGKYIVPPFTHEEICQIIEEPAYRAGLEFSPPSLIDKIADEVYSSQSTGLLPLMSFTLSELYKEYLISNRKDGRLLESDYSKLGGVIGGLQTRGDKMYKKYETDHQLDYKKYQRVMKNIMLRMVYMAAGELAGQRVLKQDLVYSLDNTNRIVTEVLVDLDESHLIVSKENKDRKQYFEPAHDVLIRSWGQIWDWIGNLKKETFLLRDLLSQALIDYESNDKRNSLLWSSNPRLDDLEIVVGSDDNWLNRKEEDFVRKSIKRRNEAVEAAQKEQNRKNARNKMLISILAAFIFVGAIVVLYVMRSMSRRTNIAYANLVLANVDTIADRRFALDMLIRANSLFRSSNSHDSLFAQALNTSNKQIVKLFNKSDLSSKIISQDEFTITKYILFDNDSRMLVTFTDNANKVLSVLYDATGNLIKSWPFNSFHVENSNLVAVIDSPKIVFYHDTEIKVTLPINKSRFRYGISGLSAFRSNFLIRGLPGDLVLCDSNGIIRNLNVEDPSTFLLTAEFMKNGDIVRIENVSQKQTANGYQRSYSGNYISKIRFYTANNSYLQGNDVDAKAAFVSPGKEKVVIEDNDRWILLTAGGPKYLDSALSRRVLKFDEQSNIFTYGDSSLHFYNPNGVFRGKSENDFINYHILDLYDSLALVVKHDHSNQQGGADKQPDSIFLINICAPSALPVFFRSANNVRDATFAKKGTNVILITASIESLTFNDIYDIYDIYDISTKEKKANFIIYPATAFITQVLNSDFQRDLNPQIYNSENSSVTPLARSPYFSSTNSSFNSQKIKLYRVQNPIVRFADDPDSIVEWTKKIPSNIPKEEKKIEKYLNYTGYFDWLPF